MEDIIGHNLIISKLMQIVETRNISHAYIFEGPSGVGKFLVAKKFAQMIMCSSPASGKACGLCESCLTFENSPDFNVVSSEDNKIIKVDQIREMSSNIVLKPVSSSRKVVIINDGELMNESAQNALLKILEEPPEFATIIIITEDKDKLLPTIRSRAIYFKFLPLSDIELKSYFNNADDLIIKFARGSIGKFIELSNCDYLDEVKGLYHAFNSNDLLKMNSAISKLKEHKDIKDIIQNILQLLIFTIFDEINNNFEIATKKISIIEECKSNIKRNANLDIALDYMIVKLWELCEEGD